MNELETARRQIPVTAHRTYLNTASTGPVTRIYAETLEAATVRDLEEGRMTAERFEAIATAREAVRHELAGLLGCDSRKVFLTQGTGAGLDQVISALPLSAGDELVSTSAEHEACTAPLERCAQASGAVIRAAAMSADSSAVVEAVAALITPRTRLIALSAVAFETGQRLPIGEIARLARGAGVPVLVDAAQCAGAAELDVEALGVDFCALPLQKWLCGPEGLGALYVRSPDASGLSRLPHDEVTHGRGIFEATAASLAWLRNTLGWPWIFERTALLARHARDAVTALDPAALVTPERYAGITTLSCRAAALPDAAETMARRGFVVRHLPELGAFRISTAFYNEASEIDAFLAAALDSHDA